MRRFLRRTLTRLSGCESGNAVLMTAVGLPALLGATGYGVDTAQWYMWQRELQHSVDQAALGGAWALAYEQPDYELRAQQEFYANQNVTEGFDTAPVVRKANFEFGTDNSVIVTASATRMLPFTGLLLDKATTVSASAQAAFRNGGTFNACLITLNPDGTTFQVGGNANVIANCGLGALSCSDDAIVIDGSATVETTSIVTCGTASVPEANEAAVTEHVTSGLEDAYAAIPIPQPAANTPTKNDRNQDYCVGNGQKAIATLVPAVYVGGIVAKCATTLASGVYFIDGGVLDFSTGAPVVGKDVLFVLRKGAQIKLGGQGGSGSIALDPMSKEQLQATPYAADAEELANMLFIEEKEEDSTPVDHQVNGNTKLNLEGVLYLPNGNVQINGDSGTTTELCFQISAWTLDIRGSAYLRTLCDVNNSTNLGSAADGVRLVA
jgi:Flp pilus assembly protein TadG